MTYDIDRARSRATHGCGDNSCMVHKPSGMATNGGCRCWDVSQHKLFRHAAQEIVDAYDAGVKAGAAERELFREALRSITEIGAPGRIFEEDDRYKSGVADGLRIAARHAYDALGLLKWPLDRGRPIFEFIPKPDKEAP